MEDGHPYLSSRQAALHLGVSEAALRLWRSQGRGPRYFRLNRLVRYRRLDLDAWVEDQSGSAGLGKAGATA